MAADDATRAPGLRVHGGELRGLVPAPHLSLLDLSVNVNPYGPMPAMVAAVRAAPLERYPEPTSLEARRAIARRTGFAEDELVVGPGAADLLWTLVRVWMRARVQGPRVAGEPAARVVVVEPAFSELAAAVEASGAEVLGVPTSASDGFRLDPARLLEASRAPGVRLVALCSPANPTGTLTSPDVLERLARDLAVPLLVDESFLSLSTGAAWLEVPLPPEVLRLRSLTKDFAIPGLRVGYLRAPAMLASCIEAARPPWSTSAPAQAAARVAMTREAEVFLAASRARLLADRARQTSMLRARGMNVLPSETVFTLLDVGPDDCAEALTRRLVERHAVLVRDGTSFGLPGHVRIAARPEADDARILAALDAEVRR